MRDVNSTRFHALLVEQQLGIDYAGKIYITSNMRMNHLLIDQFTPGGPTEQIFSMRNLKYDSYNLININWTRAYRSKSSN